VPLTDTNYSTSNVNNTPNVIKQPQQKQNTPSSVIIIEENYLLKAVFQGLVASLGQPYKSLMLEIVLLMFFFTLNRNKFEAADILRQFCQAMQVSNQNLRL